MSTARICDHARDRCVEMGISTKVAKRIVRNPTMVLPDFQGNPDRRFVYSDVEPEYAVVICQEDGEPDTVITVLYYTPQERFERPAA